MSHKRIQLTLFAESIEAESLESVRKRFNPEQYELIKCHVTLCREDEFENTEKFISNLERLNYASFRINFGSAIRFSEGKGILIPALGHNKEFHALRELILSPEIANSKKAEPHITLMHPRNSTCTDILYEQLKMIELPNSLEFKKISLIVQVIGKKWNILREFQLLNN